MKNINVLSKILLSSFVLMGLAGTVHASSSPPSATKTVQVCITNYSYINGVGGLPLVLAGSGNLNSLQLATTVPTATNVPTYKCGNTTLTYSSSGDTKISIGTLYLGNMSISNSTCNNITVNKNTTKISTTVTFNYIMRYNNQSPTCTTAVG